MSAYERVRQAKKKSVGTKHTMRMVEQGKAVEVYVAKDADPRITKKIIELCEKKGVTVIYVDSMKALGKACGIDVGAATAAVVNE